jgi:hypothetical protein
MLVQEHLETGPYVLDFPLVALCVGFRTEPLNGVFVLICGFHIRFSLLNPVHDRHRAKAVTWTQLSSIDGLIIPSQKDTQTSPPSKGRRPDFYPDSAGARKAPRGGGYQETQQFPIELFRDCCRSRPNLGLRPDTRERLGIRRSSADRGVGRR